MDPADDIEMLVTRRPKRSTAGNRYVGTVNEHHTASLSELLIQHGGGAG